jgi:hypothetical protein
MATDTNMPTFSRLHIFPLFILISPLLVGVANAYFLPEIAQAIPQDLVKRSSFLGGWAVYTPGACPDQTTQCAYTSFCCPTNTVCLTEGLAGAVACCPDRKCPLNKQHLPTLLQVTFRES